MSERRRVALKLDLQWPHKRHTGIFAGAQQYAKGHGWATFIDEFVDESSHYDGIIARATRPLYAHARKHGIPLVNVWLNSPVRNLLPGVFPDYSTSGRLRADHLIARGFRNFAALVEWDVAAKLEAGEFNRKIREAGCQSIEARVSSNSTRSQSVWKKNDSAINDWMDRWILPIGVHVHSDLMGRIVAQKCLERGWRVPEDVGIVAGLNEEAICDHPQPSLSSVEIGYERVGYKAAELLDQLLDQKLEAGSTPHIFIPPQGLIVRESSDFYSVEDELVARALTFISANSHRDIGQDDVAKAVSTETRTLQSRFRRVLDRPIARVIRHVRIDRAKRELTQSNRSITVIARGAGFSSAERLNEVFRRELGISPSQYRKQHQPRT